MLHVHPLCKVCISRVQNFAFKGNNLSGDIDFNIIVVWPLSIEFAPLSVAVISLENLLAPWMDMVFQKPLM